MEKQLLAYNVSSEVQKYSLLHYSDLETERRISELSQGTVRKKIKSKNILQAKSLIYKGDLGNLETFHSEYALIIQKYLRNSCFRRGISSVHFDCTF